MTTIQEPRRALIARILEGDGKATQALRRAAFDDAGLPEELGSLLGTVARNPHAVTDRDVADALASGFTEDQIFEFVVCAAVGQATRQHDAALGALAAALSEA